ncbi:MAG: lamin tail domain-containing protein, partial [Thermoplasmata archaeon]|nr:lamin tail domain-containing protein [Thermoplasmata archaeon]
MKYKIRMKIPIVILIVIAILCNIMIVSISYIEQSSPTAARTTIILNEIMANAADEDTGEFVELYNPGAVSVDVLNWYVQDAADTNDQIEDYTGIYDWGFSGTTIPAGGYCLYVDPEYSGEYNGYLNLNADVSKVIMVTTSQDTTVGNGLTNGGDNITIRDASLVLIDEYEWTSDPGNNVSWGRYPNGGTNWIAFPKSTPGASNGDIPDIVINELMYNPEGSDAQGEWVEIYNNGTDPINLTSWELTDSDGHDYIFPILEFPPDTYIVIYTTDGTDELEFDDNTANLYIGETSSIWTNTGDDVQLNNDAGVCIDYINYSNGTSIDPPPLYINWTGELPEALEGNSLALHPNGWDNDSAEDWAEETGANITKGRNNDEIYGVKLEADKTYRQVNTGGTALFNLTVQSLGNMDDNIDLNITSQITPGWSADLEQDSIYFSPSMGPTSELVQLTVTAPNDIAMGNMAVVNVTATSQNDTNKCSTVTTITVIPGSDIKVNWLKFDGVENHLDVIEGAVVTLKASIKNQGELNASSFNISFYLDNIIVTNIIDTKSYDSINTGGYKYPSVSWDTLHNPGNHTINIVIDPEGVIADYNANNNIFFGSINVTPSTINISESNILITKVYYDTHINYEPNEFIKLSNPTATEVNISGWYLADYFYTAPGESISFPEGSVIKPYSDIHITNDADMFYQQSGFWP